MARESRVGHGRATFGPRWHEWRRLGVTAKAAVTGAGRAGTEATSRKARRGRNRAGRRNLRAMLLAEGVAALPVRALGGRDRQPQLLADGSGEEAPERMRLPAGGLHQVLQGGAVGALEQVQDLGGLAALADTLGRLGSRGALWRPSWAWPSLRPWACRPCRFSGLWARSSSCGQPSSRRPSAARRSRPVLPRRCRWWRFLCSKWSFSCDLLPR